MNCRSNGRISTAAGMNGQSAVTSRTAAGIDVEAASMIIPAAPIFIRDASIFCTDASLKTQASSLEVKGASMKSRAAVIGMKAAVRMTQAAVLQMKDAVMKMQDAVLNMQDASLNMHDDRTSRKDSRLSIPAAAIDMSDASQVIDAPVFFSGDAVRINAATSIIRRAAGPDRKAACLLVTDETISFTDDVRVPPDHPIHFSEGELDEQPSR
jgi:hypothetical protein